MHPTLFTVPGAGWEVQAYGALMGLALLLGWYVTLRLARADLLPTDRVGTLYVVSIVAGILGGRAHWMLQQPTPFEWSRLVALPAGGLSVVGGIFCALVASAIYCARARLPWFAVMDCGAPAFSVGVIIERIGAFLAGADFGAYVGPRDVGYDLAVRYPAGTPVYRFHRVTLDGMDAVSDVASAPVHPTQLYAAGMAVITLLVALWLRRRRRFSGQVFFAVFGLYVIARMIVEEPLRYDAVPDLLGPLRTSMVSALGLCLILAIAYQLRDSRARREDLQQWRGGPWTPGREASQEPAG
ncbi:MAG: prolipoprotein diacylglyceryl transferase [Myxococcales bacterium]|nr:prolipoprotein diacylglyceryl transferase [Myxococcales bacterium]